MVLFLVHIFFFFAYLTFFFCGENTLWCHGTQDLKLDMQNTLHTFLIFAELMLFGISEVTDGKQC